MALEKLSFVHIHIFILIILFIFIINSSGGPGLSWFTNKKKVLCCTVGCKGVTV